MRYDTVHLNGNAEFAGVDNAGVGNLRYVLRQWVNKRPSDQLD